MTDQDDPQPPAGPARADDARRPSILQRLARARVWIGGGALALIAIAILQMWGASPARAANEGLLGPLWRGEAHFQQVGSLNWPSPPQQKECCQWVSVLDGKWYLFNRQKPAGGRPDYCPNVNFEVVVRESSDQGRTWSEPAPVASPSSGRLSDACAVLDGSSFYDAQTDTWHLLSQCMAAHDQGGWGLCHYTRRGRSPMGPFVADAANPVVRSGQLWSRICAGGSSGCAPGRTREEGTPDFLFKRNGYYYFTFHGWDGRAVRSYRGEAKTADFHTFIVNGPDLPSGALFGPEACEAWNPGCVGAGGASTIVTGDYQYMLAETPNMSLLCVNGQNWVISLVRARLDQRPNWRGGWEAFPGNPLVTPHWSGPDSKCGLQYGKMFIDGADVFLIYEDFGPNHDFVERRLLKLVPGAGPPVAITRSVFDGAGGP